MNKATKEMPDCFCNEAGATSCDWVFGATLGYSRPGDDKAVKNSVGWDMENIPQLLAHVILQAMLQTMNAKGLDVYAAWQRGCFDGDSHEEMVERAKSLIQS